MTWLTDIIRWVFFLLDKLIYFFVQQVYGLFIEIANTTLFNDDIIGEFSGKVYALVGIFMLFKVSFSLLTYIINPDEFTDKNKGISKIISAVITSLVMIIVVPYVFSYAMKLQSIILRDDIIARIFSSQEYNISSQDTSTGSHMALMTFGTFYHDEKAGEGSISQYNSLSELFDTEVNEKDSDKDYVMHYDWLISTIVGVVLVLLLLSFCFDIAVRSVKIGFLRMLAPIPIIARIDPKKGNEVFNKWVKTCISTYLDLFTRLIAIFFAIYIIGSLDQMTFSSVTGDEVTVSGLTKVFIILGALMFAKQIPKLIEDLTGVKMGGNFQLNPLKKIENEALGGKIPRAAAGAALGLGMGAVGTATGAGGLRWLSGMTHGLSGGLKGKKIGDIQKDNISRNQKMRQAIADGSTFGGRIGATLSNAVGLPTQSARLEANVHDIDEQIKTIDNNLKSTKDSIADRKAFTDKVSDMEKRAVSKIENGEAGIISEQYKSLMNRAEQLRESMRNGTGATAEQVARAEMAASEYLNNTGMQDYIDNVTGFSNGARIVATDGKTVLRTDTTYTQSDAAMSGMHADLVALTAGDARTYDVDGTGATVTIDNTVANSGAAALHGTAGQVTGSANYDTRTIIRPAETNKQNLEQQKVDIYEAQRVAKANENATK